VYDKQLHLSEIDCRVLENVFAANRYRNNERVSVAFTVTDYDSSLGIGP